MIEGIVEVFGLDLKAGNFFFFFLACLAVGLLFCSHIGRCGQCSCSEATPGESVIAKYS